MLARSAFDEIFIRLPCFKLRPPVSSSDLDELGPSGTYSRVFADAKIPAADLKLSHTLLDQGFRKICTQIQLSHDVSKVPTKSPLVEIEDHLVLMDELIFQHAANFEASRFRQDPMVGVEVANMLYGQWIRNSLSGSKRIAHIGADFCTFSDSNSERSIDLLSVLRKRKGFARLLLEAIISDAYACGCSVVRVVTETENAGALAAYRSVGFELDHFMSVFHLYRPD